MYGQTASRPWNWTSFLIVNTKKMFTSFASQTRRSIRLFFFFFSLHMLNVYFGSLFNVKYQYFQFLKGRHYSRKLKLIKNFEVLQVEAERRVLHEMNVPENDRFERLWCENTQHCSSSCFLIPSGPGAYYTSGCLKIGLVCFHKMKTLTAAIYNLRLKVPTVGVPLDIEKSSFVEILAQSTN